MRESGRRGETEDSLYQAIQYGKEKGPPVRWAGTEGNSWDETGQQLQDQTCHGKKKPLLLFQSFHAFSAGQLLSFSGNPE